MGKHQLARGALNTRANKFAHATQGILALYLGANLHGEGIGFLVDEQAPAHTIADAATWVMASGSRLAVAGTDASGVVVCKWFDTPQMMFRVTRSGATGPQGIVATMFRRLLR